MHGEKITFLAPCYYTTEMVVFREMKMLSTATNTQTYAFEEWAPLRHSRRRRRCRRRRCSSCSSIWFCFFLEQHTIIQRREWKKEQPNCLWWMFSVVKINLLPISRQIIPYQHWKCRARFYPFHFRFGLVHSLSLKPWPRTFFFVFIVDALLPYEYINVPRRNVFK